VHGRTQSQLLGNKNVNAFLNLGKNSKKDYHEGLNITLGNNSTTINNSDTNHTGNIFDRNNSSVNNSEIKPDKNFNKTSITFSSNTKLFPNQNDI